MIMLSPNHFPLEHLLLELGQKCHRCGPVRSGEAGLVTVRQGEGRRGTEWGSSAHEVFSLNQP